MRYAFLVLALCAAALSSMAVAQPSSVASHPFEQAPDRFDSGTLYRYSMVLGQGKPATDYWLYLGEGGIARTLYDSSRVDGSGTLREDWKLDLESFRILERRAENLAPAGKGAFTWRSWRYDWDARKLRSAYGYPGAGKAVPPPETIQYEPEIRQHELGLFFTVFFRYLKPDAEPFTILYDSYGHPIFMEVRPAGEETVNGVPCLRYQLRGRGLWSRIVGQGGRVWIARDDPRHFLVKQTMRIGFSWTMRDFSLEFAEERPASASDWEGMAAAASAKAGD